MVRAETMVLLPTAVCYLSFYEADGLLLELLVPQGYL